MLQHPAREELVGHLRHDRTPRTVLTRKAPVVDPSAAAADGPTPTERVARPAGAGGYRRHAPPVPRRAYALRDQGAPSIRPTRARTVTLPLRDGLFRRNVRASSYENGSRTCHGPGHRLLYRRRRRDAQRAQRRGRTSGSNLAVCCLAVCCLAVCCLAVCRLAVCCQVFGMWCLSLPVATQPTSLTRAGDDAQLQCRATQRRTTRTCWALA